MKKKEKKIQTILLIVGLLLILLTYFYYPYIDKKKFSVQQKTNEILPSDSDIADNKTFFENLEYQGLYDLDKKFLVKSKKAQINKAEPDIVIMQDMHVILYLSDGRIVNIFSDQGKYNKANYDCFFEKNVRASDGQTKIFSDNLDLLGNESEVKIYNNVNINYPTGSSLSADKVDYDFETKHFKISMFDDKRIKMKIFK